MKILSGVALVLTTLVLAACGGSSNDSTPSDTSGTTGQEQPAKQDDTATEGNGADGKEIFAANCASCHTLAAADATGSVGPDLDSTKPSEALTEKMVESGGAGMPAFSGQLSAEEISEVSEFVSDNAGQ